MEYSFLINYEDGTSKRSSVLYEADNVFQAMSFALRFFFPVKQDYNDNSKEVYNVIYSIEVFVNFVSLDENNLPCIKSVSCGVISDQINN